MLEKNFEFIFLDIFSMGMKFLVGVLYFFMIIEEDF